MATLLIYLGLGALITCEEAGLFLLPGDVSLVAAGMQARQGGTLLLVAWAIASAGMLLGSSALFYLVGRSHRSPRVLPERVRRLIRRHGARGVMVARMLPGLRNATVLAAAATPLPYRVFLLGLLPAAALWSGILLGLGWLGGPIILSVLLALDQLPGLKLLSFGLVVAGAAFAWRRTRRAGAAADR